MSAQPAAPAADATVAPAVSQAPATPPGGLQASPPLAPPQPLDLLQLPLWGSRLIEASAGTGKTWTLAALMLRLVLGHGTGSASGPPDPDLQRTGFGRALMPGEVLVMTFTRAATRELADRIRSRLLQAARVFRGVEAVPADDPVLSALLEAHACGAGREAAAGRLALAADAMDEAAVHTLDAWCQRMLREHAFDSGCLFDEELLPAEAELLHEAACDHWRCHVLPLDDAGLAAVTEVWPRGVDDMARDVAELLQALPEPPGSAAPVLPLGPELARAREARAQALAGLKSGWTARARDLQAWIEAQLADTSAPWDRRKLAVRHCATWCQTLATWAQDETDGPPDLKRGWDRLSPDGLAEAWNGQGPAPLPPGLDALQALRGALQALPRPARLLRVHAAEGVHQRLQALKAVSGRYGFADLLHRLDAALDETRPGRAEDARRLRERILARYPVAIVDEFQDTSPVQLRILDRLYRLRDHDPRTALLLIGDPKQSIYAFRGADIRSYLQARLATAGRHHALDTNFRSTGEAVAAVNAVFGRAEQRSGGGAFDLRDDHGLTALPFVPVRARGRRDRLSGPAGGWPGLQICRDTEPLPARELRLRLARECARHVVDLLQTATLQRGDATAVPLQPADIAVLVRSRREAGLVRRALQRCGVPSVYLSDQDSVFASEEAADLLRLLQAVAEPRDARRVRAALATRLLDLPLPVLRRLAQDDDAFDAQAQQLGALQDVWQRQGVLAMLRQALHRLDLPRRWLGGADGPDRGGERRMTNLLHLAELLQQASVGLEGEQALLRWLTRQIDGAGTGLAGDEQVLRLESDADRVQVVTVHKSKGLEYPVVCLPFAAGFRAVDSRRGWVRRLPPGDDAAGAPAAGGAAARSAPVWEAIDFAPGKEALAAADGERLREDLRLLYVALTRARHHTWMGAGVQMKRSSRPAREDAAEGAAGNHWHDSALGRLLTGESPQSPAQIEAAWQALAQSCPAIALQAAQPGDVDLPLPRWQPDRAPPALPPPLEPPARIDRGWRLASFSALVREVPAALAPALLPAQVRDDEGLQTPQGPPPGPEAHDAGGVSDHAPARPDDAPWHRFPRGTGPGNLLHELLEHLALVGFGQAGAADFAERVRQRCAQAGHAAHAEDLLQWLGALVQVPLPPLGAPLAGLERVLPEMEFWLPNPRLDTARLDALCQAELLPGRPRPPLPARRVQGLLMGFADLVVQHQGRWWVLDHKSNALGDSDAAYDTAALQQAVAAHRYDVQGAIYLLALHRLLRQRLGAGYDPATQLGGAVFLFLRGLRGPVAGCCTLPATPRLLQSLQTLLSPPA